MITDVKKLLSEQGQAIMELVLFIPFMLMMYFTIMAIGNAINGSINQQKITRGYFYYRHSNNSTMPRPRRDGIEPSDNWRSFGMQIMGWADRFEDGGSPVAPCYKFNMPLSDLEEDSCETAYAGTSTQFIRIQTVYGICGATYSKGSNNQNIRHPVGSSPTVAISGSACSIVE